MKFLIQIPQLIYAGAEKVLVSFANCLVSHGHEVEILETYDRGFLKPEFDSRVTFHVICSDVYTKKYYASMEQIRNEKNIGKCLLLCCKKAFSRIVGYEKFAKRMAEQHYKGRVFDVAINYLESENPSFILNQIRANKKFQWIHTDVSKPETKPEIDRYVPLYSLMDRIFCVSEYATAQFKSQYASLADKTTVLYNFFDMKHIIDAGKTPYDYQTTDTVLLSVGRMTPQKKYLRFLDVLYRLRNDGYRFTWHILGIGGDHDAICDKINALGLNDCVMLHGKQENPYQYMTGCDLFVLPSGWEGFPTVTVEAKILGCAVMATDVSGIREQLVHGETGWIVENSESGIYEGLRCLLDHPEVIAHLRNHHGIEHIVDSEITYERFMNYANTDN